MGRPPSSTAEQPLSRYKAKRNFGVTPEPAGQAAPEPAAKAALSFVIQKHWATRLHYDFRLELDGVLLSWAVPKGPSFDPKDMRMAVHVEDHPLAYGGFEGTIPPRQYGAGTVIVWDRGSWEPVGDPRAGMRDGKLVFELHGEKLAGLWELVRIAKPGDKQDPWMLFKKRDAWARPLAEYDVIAALPDSVIDKPLGLLEARASTGLPAQPRLGHAPDAARTPDLAAALRVRSLPKTLSPQLATAVDAGKAPAGPGWIAENKLDGYRILARIDGGRARLITRGGHDWTDRMAGLAEEVEGLDIKTGWLDGEIVVIGDQGLPDFNRLQNAIDSHEGRQIVYFLFDAPFLDGMDLRAVPLWSRRALLAQRIAAAPGSDRIRYSDDFHAPLAQLLQAAGRLQLEGLMLKRADAPYVSARTETWLKLKVSLRQEFIVCGFTQREGSTGEIGSLMLAMHDEAGTLRFAGNVGTGWDSRSAADLHRRLLKLETKQPAVAPESTAPGRWGRLTVGREQWVKPQLVVEVAFANWTPDGMARHAVFKGLRQDKPASAIVRESAPAAEAVPSVRLTHPERVIDPSTGLRKLDLFRYYESIAERLLPHLRGRPVSLVRAPQGLTRELFFQKHAETPMPGLKELKASLWPGHAALLTVDGADGVLAAAQLNVIEFHTWNSTAKAIDKPDRVIFDLDPGDGVGWPQVQEAALLTHTLLDELGLRSWLKTSGGKGLHVVVPLAPRLDYAAVKAFSQAVAEHLAQAVPQRFVARSGAGNRVGRIFVDYLRNGHGATTAAAFSARSRPGLGVSMPVSWAQLPALKSGAQWTIATAREYLSFEKTDPWADYAETKQTLTSAMKRMGMPPAAALAKEAPPRGAQPTKKATRRG